jgi:hypothetical protein
LITILLTESLLNSGKASSYDEGSLKTALFADYDRYITPAGDDGGPVVVKQSLHFVKVVSLVTIKTLRLI